MKRTLVAGPGIGLKGHFYVTLGSPATFSRAAEVTCLLFFFVVVLSFPTRLLVNPSRPPRPLPSELSPYLWLFGHL